MAKRETKETYKDTKQEKIAADQRYNTAQQESQQRIENIQPGMGALRDDLIIQNKNMIDAPAINRSISAPTPVSYNAISAPRQLETQNINMDKLNETYSGYKNLGPAFTPEREAALTKDANNLRNLTSDPNTVNRMQGMGGFEALINNGGLNDEAIHRLRGKGIYDEFAETGGLTARDRADISANALAPISSFARGTRDEMDRRRAVSGGYSPGFDSANRALMRDTSRALSDAGLNSRLQVMDRVNQGRLAGVGGLVGAEQGLQSLRTGNIARGAQGIADAETRIAQLKASGIESAANIDMQIQDRVNQYKLAGLSGQEALSKAIADVEGQNIQNANQVGMFNIGNEMAVSQFNAANQLAVDQANAAALQNANMFNAGLSGEDARFNLGRQQAGIGGLQNIYNTDVGMYENEADRANSLLGGRTQANLGYLGNQSQLAVQPGIGGNIMNAVGSAAGVGAALVNPGGLFGKATQAVV